MSPFRKETQSGSKNMDSAFSWFNHKSTFSKSFKATRSWLGPAQLARIFALAMLFVVYREAQQPSLSRTEASAYLRPWATHSTASASQLFLGASCFLFALIAQFFPSFISKFPIAAKFGKQNDVSLRIVTRGRDIITAVTAGQGPALFICFGLAIYYPNLLIWVLLCLVLCGLRLRAHQGHAIDSRGALLSDLGLAHPAASHGQGQALPSESFAKLELAIYCFALFMALLNAVCTLARNDFWGMQQTLYAAPLFLFSAGALFLKKTGWKRTVNHAI